MQRFTQKQISEMSDLDFAASVLKAHADTCKNPYTVLARKYRMAAYRLEVLAQKEKSSKKNWWEITYTDQTGQKMTGRNMRVSELERIGEMVTCGYACGEIIAEKNV